MIDLILPRQPEEALLNDRPVPWSFTENTHYRFELRFDRKAELEIRLSDQWRM